MELKFNHNLCAKFSRLKKAGFDDAKALEKTGIKTPSLTARKLCDWYKAKLARERQFKEKEKLARYYLDLKGSGMTANEALDFLSLHGVERREFVCFVAYRKFRSTQPKKEILEQLNSDNEEIVYNKKKIISKIIELKATKNTPLWIMKYFNISPYTAGLIHRELNNS
jgi:hypothetical protein